MDKRARAEQILLEFLAEHPSPDESGLQVLVARHPELVDDLSLAVERWARGLGALQDLSFPDSTVLADGAAPGVDDTAHSQVTEETPFTADLRSRLSHQGDRRQRYVDAAEIARGGMGRILRAFDADLQRPLALKVLREGPPGEDPSRSERREARFVEEAQVTAQLDHPGIVPVHDLGVDDRGRIFFTLKLVKGRTLGEVLEEHTEGLGSWNTTRVLGILLQVCEAMAYAHQKRVIHRDLKPSNVMVGRFGEVFVMDFGLARVLDQEDTHDIRVRPARSVTVVISERARAAKEDTDSPLITMDGDVVGTPAYMAPEQARGELDTVGPKADLYGVGAMLYHLLAGTAPYADHVYRDPYELLDLVKAGPPTSLAARAPGTPAQLLSICERAMARDATHRYDDMKALADDLRAYLENRVVQAHQSGAVAELRMWIRRNRGLAAACFALLVLVVSGSGGWAWLVRDRNKQLAHAHAERLQALDILSARELLGDESRHTPNEAGTRRMERFIGVVDDILARRSKYEAMIRDPLSGLSPDLRLDVQELVANLDTLADIRARVRRRLDVARSLPRVSLVDHAEDWRIAREQIRDNALYGELDLEPQLGLVPLRENPETSLWEFWHVASGAQPDPDHPSVESGMVLVLLPGAVAGIGSPPEESDHEIDETYHEVEILPHFMSRFEVTQAQYRRMTSQNPSTYLPSSKNVAITALHPVDSVTRPQAERLAGLCGLRLPTEPEWEYAYRGGSTTAFPFGEARASVEGRENVADAAYHEAGGISEGFEEWDDGYPVHAPVGSFKPNAFGIYDLGGNVSEWTSSPYESDYGLGGDPAPPGGPTGAMLGVVRGGNHYASASFSRAACRQPYHVNNSQVTIGVRLARSIND